MTLRTLVWIVPVLVGAAVAAGGVPPGEAPAADPDEEILAGRRPLEGLRLRLVTARPSFELGEPIPVTMAYSYTGDRPLAIMKVSYDRSGRISDFGFRAVDERGQDVRDPVLWTSPFGGGLRGSGRLTKDQPFEQTVELNEWLCFDRPGRYTVTASSRIVRFDETGRWWDGPVIPLEGEPLEIAITPPDDRGRRDRIARAEADLKAEDPETRRRAARVLRFLVDPRAIPSLVRALADDDGNVVVEALFGVLSFRDLGPVKDELLRMLDRDPRTIDPDRLGTYIDILAASDLRARGVRAEPFGEDFQAAERPWQELLAGKFKQRLATLPPREAAEATIRGLAYGPFLPRSEAEHWRRILDQAEALGQEEQSRAAAILQVDCRNRELIPHLKEVAANGRLEPSLRSAAIVALHVLGDDSSRDLVADDLMAARPKLSAAAHETLGGFKGREVDTALIALARAGPGDVRSSAAGRLRDFGTDCAPALLELLRRGDLDPNLVRAPLLEALTIQAPEAAVPALRAAFRLAGPHDGTLRDTASLLASRIDSPAAQQLVLDRLRDERDSERAAQATAVGRSWQDARTARYRSAIGTFGHSPHRSPPADTAVAGSFVPELLALARADPSESVQLAAAEALVTITEVPGPGQMPATRAQIQRNLPLWEGWWHARGARFGRWGPSGRGLALKASADRGEYEVGEQIRLTIRVRRLAGADLAAVPILLRGRIREAGLPHEAPGHTWDLDTGDRPAVFPGESPGGEARIPVEIQKDGGFDRAGTFTVEVEAVPDGEGRPSGGEALRSVPLTIALRPEPGGVTWSEPRDGLALGVSLPQRTFPSGEAIPVEVRLRNAKQAGRLTIASPWREQAPLRFLSFRLRDAEGKPLDLGAEPPQPEGTAIGRPVDDLRPALVTLQPGQSHRLTATLNWRGGRLHPERLGPPRAVAGGGTFAGSIAYECPTSDDDAGVQGTVTWRGRLHVGLGTIRIDRPTPGRSAR